MTLQSCQARNSTTRPLELGHRPAASMLPAGSIPQHCFAMARCWSQVVLAARTPSRPRKSTIQPREIGQSQAASIMLALSTPRRCSPVASCWSQVAIAPAAAFSRARNCIMPVPAEEQAVVDHASINHTPLRSVSFTDCNCGDRHSILNCQRSEIESRCSVLRSVLSQNHNGSYQKRKCSNRLRHKPDYGSGAIKSQKRARI
jgi:hypothetical protein